MKNDSFASRDQITPEEDDEGDLRRRILDGARHLLVRGGYQNLSMRRLARAIGYSATSIYLHFESKDDLFHALIDEGMERLNVCIREATEGSEQTDPYVKLEALCRAFVRFGLDNPEYYEVMFLLRPETMERYPPEKYRRARRSLDLAQALMKRGADEGCFDVADPLLAASALWSSLHGTVSLLLARRVDARIEPEAFAEASIHLALRGVVGSSRTTAD